MGLNPDTMNRMNDPLLPVFRFQVRLELQYFWSDICVNKWETDSHELILGEA